MKKSKSSQLVSFEEVKAHLLKKKGIRDAYYKKDRAFEIAKEVMRLRIALGLTQEELARKINTKQPSIARVESGNYVPSMKMLWAIAKALNLNLEVRFSDMREVGISQYRVGPQTEQNTQDIIPLSAQRTVWNDVNLN